MFLSSIGQDLELELDNTTSVGIKLYQCVYNITMFIYLSGCHISFETDIASKKTGRREEVGGWCNF